MTILLVDNYDSFTHNLADAMRRTGRDVLVARNDAVDRAQIADMQPEAIVLSPGPGHPGNPRDFGVCADLIRKPFDIPMLGICLGMQGMALHTGGTVGPAPELVHGEADEVHLEGPRFEGIPQPTAVGRYHSLCVVDAGPQWHELGRAADGTLMAIEHRERPWLGLQFHPESILTPHGQAIIERFLP
ncbi:MAG: anthranilate synthase component II [Thermoplasmatota archaeon]